jgi:hypothetical protein
MMPLYKPRTRPTVHPTTTVLRDVMAGGKCSACGK